MEWKRQSVPRMRQTDAFAMLLLLISSMLSIMHKLEQQQQDRPPSHPGAFHRWDAGSTEKAGKEIRMQSGTPISDEKQPDADDTLHLSERERLILTLIAEGRTDNEIAMRLCLSAKTVSWYVDGIRARFDARSRAQAVAVAMRQGLLLGDESPGQGS
jgi:DNA-binding NarL/FixJ family response regulator